MATESTFAVKVTPSPWLQRQVSAAFGTGALLVGDLSEYTSVGKLRVNNLSATKYFVQHFRLIRLHPLALTGSQYNRSNRSHNHSIRCSKQ